MQFKPSYIPKNKRKVNYKIVVPFIVVLALGFYVLLDKFVPDIKEDKTYLICNLNANESNNLIKERKYKDTIKMSDYAVYGEFLGLYNESIELGNKDMFSGKTFFLNNICHNDERAYMMDVALDRKLPLNDLDDGFYELEVLDGLDRFHLLSDEIRNETFYTVNRNGYRKQVKILANNALFKENDEKILKENIVYLEVKTVEADKNVDVVLDPARFNELWPGFIDYGSSRDGQSEAEITYRIASKIKKELDSKNIRTEILRDDKNAKDFSGSDGRLADAYKSGAKYYFNIAFPDSGSSNDKGVTVIYSSYSSNKLASDIMTSLKDKTSIQSSNWTGINDIDGVYPTYRDGLYDRKQEIRETGGKLTGAGILIDNDSGKDSRKGMQAITVELGYMSNDHDFETVIKEEDKIVAAIVDAIVKYMEL